MVNTETRLSNIARASEQVAGNNFKLNDMVSVAVKDTVFIYWPLGRVMKVFNGNDNVTTRAAIRLNAKVGWKQTGCQITGITRPVTTC